jgi:hypothetical protein
MHRKFLSVLFVCGEAAGVIDGGGNRQNAVDMAINAAGNPLKFSECFGSISFSETNQTNRLVN